MLLKKIADYYNVDKEASATIKNAEYLFYIPPIKFNRFLLFPASFGIQFMLGIFYSWSGLDIPVEAYIYGDNGGIDRGINANGFYVLIFGFGSTAALVGPLVERLGPCKAGLIGGVVYFVGACLACIGVLSKTIAVLFVGTYVIGVGIGMCYLPPVSTLVKWFPSVTGVVCGLAVAGASAGSIVAPWLLEFLLHRLNPAMTLLAIGSLSSVVICMCSLVLRNPSKRLSANLTDPVLDETKVRQDLSQPTLLDALKSRDFILCWIMFLCYELSGVVIFSKIQPLCLNQFGKTQTTASFVNSMAGISNMLGRMVVPMTSDLLRSASKGKMGRKTVFLIGFVTQFVLILLLPTSIETKDFTTFLIVFFILIVCYASGFALIPALMSDMFSPSNVTATHGICLFAYSVAGVFGGVSLNAVIVAETKRMAPDLQHIYTLVLRILAGVVAVGMVCCLFVRTIVRDRMVPYAKDEVLRIRVLNGRLMRVKRDWKVELVSVADEQLEWEAYLQSTLNK